MKKFLDRLVKRVGKYKLLHEHLLAISGLGYVLQSLWMTNSENRKSAVLASLELLIKADKGVKQLAEQKFPFFRGIKDTDIAMAHLGWFYMHYNSLTLRDPLMLAFDELHANMIDMKGTLFERDEDTTLYQLFCIAATLNTGRVNDMSKLDTLNEEDKMLTKPLFVYLFNEAIEMLEYTNQSRLRKDFKLDSKKKKYIKSIRFFLDNPTENLRHTTYEKLNPIKQVELFTEGRTDASILSHAFRVLTMNDEPYWSITAVEKIQGAKAGGAQQLADRLKNFAEKIKTDFDKKKIIIGIFDNDSKGFQEFNGLPNSFETVNGILKKVTDMNIYALLLPIPNDADYQVYHQDKQTFKFFEIEHYFSLKLLKEQNMVEEISIPDVFEIKGSKGDFNDHILKLGSKDVFKHFITLFKELDRINNKEINYIE